MTARPTGYASAVDRRSLALLAFGGAALLGGLTGALVLLGFGLPRATAHLAAGHGLLMTLGFLGTMIALERAVALRRAWAYLTPLASGLAAAVVLVGGPAQVAGLLLLTGGVLFVAMYVAFLRIDPALHIRVQALAAIAWPVAALLWLGGGPLSATVPWLAAFLVLIICGERLELARLGRLGARARLAFGGAVGLFCVGVALTLPMADLGLRVAGLGLIALAAWLASNDLARRTVRFTGITRFIAVCLLIGYAWLAVAGVLWLTAGGAIGAAYDAVLHSLFLGFVISMVFGHAPVIIPAVLRVPLPYHPRFYVHLALLHVGLLLRVVAGDALGNVDLWRLGGLLNVVALLVFVGSSALATISGIMARRRTVTRLESGSGGRTRTYDQAVNSRPLYH